DNAVIWADQGLCGGLFPPCPVNNWIANTPYTAGQRVTDLSSHAQLATTTGMSGPPSASGSAQPFSGWSDNGTNTTDGLTWTDTSLPGFGANCVGNQLASLDLGTGSNNPPVYFTSGGIVQKVATPLSG